MFHLTAPVGLGLILAMGVGSAAWTAKLESKDGSKISGTARVETVAAPMTPPKDSLTPPAAPVESGDELRVSVTLSNAPANASLNWGLYGGKCSDEKAATATALGSPSAYSPVKVDAQGNGTATSMVKGAKVAGGNYYIGVHNSGKLAACGNLEPAKTSTD